MGYRVLIADDEPLIRLGIRSKLDWGKRGIASFSEAGDGIEALEIIRRTNPEIVITDIRMPEMDGLEMIATANESGFFPYFIIISGYAEFDYAKKAIAYGVEDYLLKPVSPDELETVIAKIISKIEQENQIQRRLAAAPVITSPTPVKGDSELNPEHNDSGEAIVAEIVTYLQSRFREEITLKSLAQKYYINENYLCRIFKMITGQSFNDCLTRIRIENACRLMKESHKSITEISERVGYEPKYFSKVFKKEMGLTPAEYLERGRKPNS